MLNVTFPSVRERGNNQAMRKVVFDERYGLFGIITVARCFVGKTFDIVCHVFIDSFSLRVANANHSKRILGILLFHEPVVFALMFDDAVNTGKIFVINPVGNRHGQF